MSEQFSLAMLLKILALPRSSYYYHIKQLKPVDKNKVLKAKIKMIYDEHKGNYGYRRITLELRNQGFLVNHKRVQRLMKLMTLTARIHLTRVRLARKLIISFNDNLKLQSPTKSVILTSQNLPFQLVHKSCIYHQF